MAHTSTWGALCHTFQRMFSRHPLACPSREPLGAVCTHSTSTGGEELVSDTLGDPIAPPVTRVTDVTVDGPRVIAVTEVMGFGLNGF